MCGKFGLNPAFQNYLWMFNSYFPLLWLEALDGFLTSSVQYICMPKGVLEEMGEIQFLHMAGRDCSVVNFLFVVLTGHSW